MHDTEISHLKLTSGAVAIKRSIGDVVGDIINRSSSRLVLREERKFLFASTLYRKVNSPI